MERLHLVQFREARRCAGVGGARRGVTAKPEPFNTAPSNKVKGGKVNTITTPEMSGYPSCLRFQGQVSGWRNQFNTPLLPLLLALTLL